ncbi:MAG: ABC transporter permease [Spirochaetia bacterium]|jgi:spermidine/putrescine transport system permease protein|nr:ABC transporter permease [Spirochaetia bacterium]
MKRNLGPAYVAPQALWLTIFFAAPLLIIVAYSFLQKGLYGGVEASFSVQAWVDIANPTLLKVSLKTLWVSLAATLVILLLALPCGYSIARSKNQALRLFLVIVPFWTNFLVRIYAWISILGNEGFVNQALRFLGFRAEGFQFLYNQGAVVFVLVYMYLPYAILPLFSTIDKFDFTLLEAARDLGSSRMQAYTKVMLPNIKGGVITAVLFTFIPIFGAYAVPLLIGGKDSYMLGNVIADQLTKTRNWPLASAISMTMTLLTAIAVFLFAFKKPKEQQTVKDIDPLTLPNGRTIGFLHRVPGQGKKKPTGKGGV